MKRQRRQTDTIEDLTARLSVLVRSQVAANLAHAIESTRDRHTQGFMAYATMKSHVASLWGTVDGKGLRVEVEQLLGVR